MGKHDQDGQGSGLRRIFVVCGAAVLALSGGGLGGYVAHAVADSSGEIAAPSVDAGEALRQEREKSQDLERRLAATLKHIAAQADLVAQAAGERQELLDLRQARDEERARPPAPVADPSALQEEQAKAEGLARDLATARQQIEAQSAALARAREQASTAQKTAERTAAELQGQIDDWGNRVAGLTRDLAVAHQENEGLAAALQVANAKSVDASRLEELQKALSRSEEQRQSLVQTMEARAAAPASKPQLVAVEMVAVRQAPPAVAPAGPAAETQRLMARAQQLIDQRNVSAARQILERAAETGHPPALFALAETYDPNVLAGWGTVGTQGDVGRARTLYGKARAGGVAEADARLAGLP
jgi:DNA repair exonuclease SbcCD ATPase subunit